MSYTSNITCKTCGVEKDKSLFRRSGKSASGYLGVRKFRKRYTARIYDPNGKELQIGTFDTAQQAHAAYVLQKQIFYPEAVIA